MSNTPIHILGAGPSGLCASINLAREGREVHVHERYECAGKRFQGDLQGLDNWSTKESVLNDLHQFGLKTTFAMTPFKEIYMSDGHRSFLKKSAEPLFYLVKRGTDADTLDTSLQKQALEQGVQIHYRSTIPPSEAQIIATGPIRKAVIAADKGVVFKTDLPNIAVGIFHDDLAHLGYSYLLITQGYGCLCTVVFKDFDRLNECFNKTLDTVQKQYGLTITDANPVGGIGSFALNHAAILNNSLLVGEAAGLQDCLWGFGIRTALTSGYLAAQSLLNNENYQELLNRQLYPFMKASAVNRYLWEKLKWNKSPIIPYLMRLPIPLRTQFRWLYKFSPIHQCLYPLAEKFIRAEYPQIGRLQ